MKLKDLEKDYTRIEELVMKEKEWLGPETEKLDKKIKKQMMQFHEKEIEGRFHEFYNEVNRYFRNLENMIRKKEDAQVTLKYLKDTIDLTGCLISQANENEKYITYLKQSYVGCFIMMLLTSHWMFSIFYPLTFLPFFIIPFCIHTRSRKKWISYFLCVPSEIVNLGIWGIYAVNLLRGTIHRSIPFSINVCGFALNILLAGFLIVFFVSVFKTKNLYIIKKDLIRPEIKVNM